MMFSCQGLAAPTKNEPAHDAPLTHRGSESSCFLTRAACAAFVSLAPGQLSEVRGTCSLTEKVGRKVPAGDERGRVCPCEHGR